MPEYATYRNSKGYITVENQKQHTENGEYKNVIYSNIGKPRVNNIITYDEYSLERLCYLIDILFDRRQK